MRDECDAEAIRAALSTGPADGPGRWGFAAPLEFHGSIGSTNDRARQLASEGAPEGTLVIAAEQTSGRGRGGRAWHSPAETGLYLSLILRPGSPPDSAPRFALLAAVAGAEALAPFAGGTVLIKWPNDLMLPARPDEPGRWRKVAGILAEARTLGDQVQEIVVGIGVNVGQGRDDFPAEIAPRATSLYLGAGRRPSRAAVAAALVERLQQWYTLRQERGDAPILDAYRRSAPDLDGRRVVLIEGGQRVVGTTAGLDPDGALRIECLREGRPAVVTIRYGEIARLEEF